MKAEDTTEQQVMTNLQLMGTVRNTAVSPGWTRLKCLDSTSSSTSVVVVVVVVIVVVVVGSRYYIGIKSIVVGNAVSDCHLMAAKGGGNL